MEFPSTTLDNPLKMMLHSPRGREKSLDFCPVSVHYHVLYGAIFDNTQVASETPFLICHVNQTGTRAGWHLKSRFKLN